MFDCHLRFGILSYGCIPKSKLNRIVLLQKKSIRLVANANYRAHTEPLFNKLGILKFSDLFEFSVVNFMHQYATKRLPISFNDMFTLLRETEDLQTRDSYYDYQVSLPIRKSITNFPRVIFIPIWNSLSSQYQSTASHEVFKKECKNMFLEKYNDFESCENLLCPECSSS